MTTRDKVLEQALEALELARLFIDNGDEASLVDTAIAAIKEELSKPAPEPIGTAGAMPGTDGFTTAVFYATAVPVGTELYTEQPPPKVPEGWQLVRDGASLAMLQSPDGRVFRLQQLGVGVNDMWGAATDNDALVSMLAACQQPD